MTVTEATLSRIISSMTQVAPKFVIRCCSHSTRFMGDVSWSLFPGWGLWSLRLVRLGSDNEKPPRLLAHSGNHFRPRLISGHLAELGTLGKLAARIHARASPPGRSFPSRAQSL